MTTETKQLNKRFQQVNTWIIIAGLGLLVVFSVIDPILLDSDLFAAWLVPYVWHLGYLCNFLLWGTLVVMLGNYVYINLFKVSRIHYYNPDQKQELVKLFKDKHVRVDFMLFKEKSRSLLSRYPNYLSEIVASIIPTALEQPFVLEQYFRAKVDNITNRFADQVNTIVLASNVAPTLGFLGTLLGLIKAFADSAKTMAEAGQMTPETFGKLQTSIQIAIITSLLGVTFKVIGSSMKHHIQVRAGRFADEIAEIPRQVMYE